jgi:signal transduction histidine kinase
MAEGRSGHVTRGRESQHWGEQMRHALVEIESQRDDAVVYLSAIKLVLDVVARGNGSRQCAQEIAEALVQQLMIEACGVAVREGRENELVLTGFSSQAQRLGGPGDRGLEEAGWLTLAQLVGRGVEPTCFRRQPDGGFQQVKAGELTSEGFFVLPFPVGGETSGALVLHSLVAPAQVFARGRALALVAEIVGQALSVARTRESTEQLCRSLEEELGITRRTLSAQEQSLRSHEDNIHGLTKSLIRSNRVKREFLGTVSHELRTPLNAILGYTALVRDGIAGPLVNDQAALLDRVLTNTRTLNALIDDILFFVQLESDRVLIQPEPVQTAELIDETLATVPRALGGDAVTLTVEVDPAASTLHVDAALVRRLLFHLVSNAFKFTPRGEIYIAVRAGEELGTAVLVVRDTGVGIPADRLSDVFELFAQADSSTTRRYSGLGMGLTLVQRCVRLLGGELVVDSKLEHGSEFRVHLPGVLTPASEGTRLRAGALH